MPEQQNIEWKSTWKDEYLKWVCGLANAQGGRIYIGKDDRDRVVGVQDYAKLLDAIPNKDDCRAQGYPEPKFDVLGEDLMVTFYAAFSAGSDQAKSESDQAFPEGDLVLICGDREMNESEQSDDEGGILTKNKKIERIILNFCEEERSLAEIADRLGLQHLSYLRKTYIKPLSDDKKLEMTHPENPRHMRLRYRTK